MDNLDNMAMMVKRLVQQIRKHEPNNSVAFQAMHMLTEIGKAGSVLRHSGNCIKDIYDMSVCEGMYAERCDDIQALKFALLAVYGLAGENPEIAKICSDAIVETT
jgi:hypothetical protein